MKVQLNLDNQANIEMYNEFIKNRPLYFPLFINIEVHLYSRPPYRRDPRICEDLGGKSGHHREA